MEVSESEKKAARWAHDLFVLNIFFFHLLLTPATIMLGIGLEGLLIPLALSLSVITYIYYRGHREPRWFVAAHWRLAFKRCKLLLIGYALTAAILLLVELLTMGMKDAHMANIMVTVITRIAIMPTLIIVMVTVVMEASATSLVSRGEVPDKILKEFPPHS
ncbi:hypothetical protein [Thiolapillus brandeum]|uniref:Uncharacterized protein n=1 Tax=Thiolapillus brandeum TaxID=1076588 RepID=A0A7U6GIM6_9GAMM|nr:hypothetical protein [Thiolapillus brandeum]BAO44329.1 conserved hypothetical protein [Thiolapillus brandeum]